MQWYLEVLKKYAVFKGRARRKEFWFFILVDTIIAFVLAMIDFWAGLVDTETTDLGLLNGLYTLAVLLPSLAVTVRRLHDTDRSGWWVLIAFVPLAGAIVLLVFMALDGESGGNQFGPDPKQPMPPRTSSVAMTAWQTSSHTEDRSRAAHCPHCGTSYRDFAAYCARCGVRRTV